MSSQKFYAARHLEGMSEWVNLKEIPQALAFILITFLLPDFHVQAVTKKNWRAIIVDHPRAELAVYRNYTYYSLLLKIR